MIMQKIGYTRRFILAGINFRKFFNFPREMSNFDENHKNHRKMEENSQNRALSAKIDPHEIRTNQRSAKINPCKVYYYWYFFSICLILDEYPKIPG